MACKFLGDVAKTLEKTMQETHYPRQTAGQLVIPDATRHDSGVKKEPLNLNSGSFFGGYPY